MYVLTPYCRTESWYKDS